jgi:hypothetical protein
MALNEKMINILEEFYLAAEPVKIRYIIFPTVQLATREK